MSKAKQAFEEAQDFSPPPAEAQPWPERKPLMRELPPAPDFPIDALGTVRADAAKKMHEIIKAPLALCGQSILAANTLAVQGHANILIDGRIYPASEYFGLLAVTGERKTATDEAALKAHCEHQDKLRKTAATEAERYQTAREAYDAARKEAVGNAKGRQAKEDAITSLGIAPEAPLEPAFIISEPTYEGLVKLFAVGQPSIGLFSDEGGQFLHGHAMSEENRIKTATGLSKFWDGKPVSRCRGGDGTSLLYGRRLSMHLMVQPGVAYDWLADPMLQAQGLLCRMLTMYPESTMGFRQYERQNLCATPAMHKFYARMSEVLNAPVQLADDCRNELKPRSLPLSPDAYELWVKFHNTVEEQLRPNCPLASIKGFAAKAAEHALRLAGSLALGDNVACATISLEYVKGGIALVSFYLNESIRLTAAANVDAELSEAAKLLAWLRQRGKQLISLVEIYQYGPGTVRDAKTASKLMDVLYGHGEVRPYPGTVEFEGVSRRNAWEVRGDE